MDLEVIQLRRADEVRCSERMMAEEDAEEKNMRAEEEGWVEDRLGDSEGIPGTLLAYST